MNPQKRTAKYLQGIYSDSFQLLQSTSNSSFNYYQFDSAIYKLEEHSIPKQIPCRDRQKNSIIQFVENGILSQGCSETLYISGVPGIGKTASFQQVMCKLKQKHNRCFQYIYLNCGKFKSADQLYPKLFFEISGSLERNKHKCLINLSNYFIKGRFLDNYQFNNKKLIVLCIDQIDFLITKDQELLYNLFQWTQHNCSKLLLAGIANTMDFPQRLKNKIASRIGTLRVVYRTYTSYQIRIIVEQRLKDTAVFQDDTIQYACNKIATCSSDIRKTLQVLRRSIDLCRNQNLNKVLISHIQQAYKQIYMSPIKGVLQDLQEYHKGILVCICVQIRNNLKPQAYSSDVYNRLKVMYTNTYYKIIYYPQFIRNIIMFKEYQFIKLKQKSKLKKQTTNRSPLFNSTQYLITLEISMDWITNALAKEADGKIFSQQLLRL